MALGQPRCSRVLFYSVAQNSYCRIDYIMMSSNLVQNVLEIKMNTIVIGSTLQFLSFFSFANNEKFIACIINQILDIFVLN